MTRDSETVTQRHRVTETDPLNRLTARIIGCAIEVHRNMGPGLLETVYETALCIELDAQGLAYVRQVCVPAYYKGRLLGEYRVDLIVEDAVIVEIKSVATILPVFEGQLLTYLKASDKRVGLLINFNTRLLKDGITRVMM